jgi:hypothetical protein
MTPGIVNGSADRVSPVWILVPGNFASTPHEAFLCDSLRCVSQRTKPLKLFLRRGHKKLETQSSLRKTAKIAEKGFSQEILPST